MRKTFLTSPLPLLTTPRQVLKQTLRSLFKAYGEVLDVVAHKNLRMRGQAFVSFASTDVAKKAQREVNRFPLYNKPMQISFARTRSDAVVKQLDADNLESHKATRLEHKSILPLPPNTYILTIIHVSNRENTIHQSFETEASRQTHGC